MVHMRVGEGGLVFYVLRLGLNFGSEKLAKISIVFKDLSRYSVFFRTEVEA